MTKSSRISCIVYSLFLAFYPSKTRRRFGAEMIEVFAEQLEGAWKRHGVLGVMRVWWIAAREVITVAAFTHLRSSMVIATVIAFAASSGLFLAFFRMVSR